MNQNLTRCRVVPDEELICEGINRAPVLLPGYIRASFDPAGSASASIQSLLPYLHPTILYATCPRHTMERGPCASRRHIHTHYYHCTHDMHIMIGAVWRVGREARARARVRGSGSESHQTPGRNSMARPRTRRPNRVQLIRRMLRNVLVTQSLAIRCPGLGRAESGAPPDGLNRV